MSNLNLTRQEMECGCVAEIGDMGETYVTQCALHEAAPALLAAVDRAERIFDGIAQEAKDKRHPVLFEKALDERDKCRAALAKARGEMTAQQILEREA